ncbi:MAG: MFS transporter [Coriobacteriia bacterium]|nr:MFS transporter [Coriobacteriia bacterium]
MKTRSDGWLRTVLIIFTGQTFSLLGSSAVNFALVWWLTAETGSAALLAYASIAAILPQAVLGPIAGPFIDRWDRRFTMIVADLMIAATSVWLLLAFAEGAPSVTLIMLVIALRSAGAAFHTPASQAAVPMYVPADQLMRVAGWSFFMSSGVAMAGPVLGAFMMAATSISAVMAVDIVGAGIAVASLLIVRIPNPQRDESESGRIDFVAEFVDGWRELIRHRGLLDLTLVLAMVTLLYMPLNALFPLMTFSHFSGDAAAASYVEVAFGAGMLVGSMMIGVMSRRFSGVQLVGAGILLVGGMLAVSGMLPSSAFWVFVMMCVLMGFSVPLFGAPITAMFQGLIDPAKLGRVMSLYMTIAMLAAPVGLLVAGPLAEQVGVAPWFAISGVLIAVMGLVAWSLPAVRALDAATGLATAGPAAIEERAF